MFIKGDTRSLDYNSSEPLSILEVPKGPYRVKMGTFVSLVWSRRYSRTSRSPCALRIGKKLMVAELTLNPKP